MMRLLKAKAVLRTVRPVMLAAVCLTVLVAFITLAANASQETKDRKLSIEPQIKKEQDLSPAVQARIRQASGSVGLILVRNSNDLDGQSPRPRGSAIIVRADGLVVTNHHVITESRTRRPYDEIFFNLATRGEVDPAASNHLRLKPLLINKEFDLALLRIEPQAAGDGATAPAPFPAIELGDSQNVQILDDLFIIGFPEKGGLSITVNHGFVEGKDALGHWIKTAARIIHGNSGGAAVNSDGKLIGIPTKVIADSQSIDRDGDGFPDVNRTYGAVGFLRPAYLVAAMLRQIDQQDTPSLRTPEKPQALAEAATITVRGTIKSASDKKPIAGALVGILPLGTEAVTEATLLTWGGSNAEGQFALRKPLPPGRYTLKVKALGYEGFTRDVEITENSARLAIEMIPIPR